jgi:DegV family protein with EDD domain
VSNQVAIVTDSTASLPADLVQQWGIKVVQLQLLVDDQINDENRYDRGQLAASMRAGRRVATAPPDPGAFFWAYQDAASSGASAVVSLHISERMSATARAAREAAQHVRIPVHILDSGTTGMSLGFAVLSAARAAAAGAQVERVVEAAERRFYHNTELLYVDTLEYLRRGGRIGAAAHLIGNAFSIKPLLTVRNGEVAPLSRVAGSKRALARLIELSAARAGSRPVELAVSCFQQDGSEAQLAEQLTARLPNARGLMIVETSTIIGAHVGPGALSITVSPV